MYVVAPHISRHTEYNCHASVRLVAPHISRHTEYNCHASVRLVAPHISVHTEYNCHASVRLNVSALNVETMILMLVWKEVPVIIVVPVKIERVKQTYLLVEWWLSRCNLLHSLLEENLLQTGQFKL